MRDYEYLIHLLYCFIHGETPKEKPDEVSFEKVYLIGKEHEISNIAFLSVEKLENKPEPVLYNEWKLNYYFSVERDSRQSLERNRVISAFHENGIRTLEAQGTVTKTLYPEPYLRLMTDIDIVIDKENIDKTMACLIELGYSITQQQEYEFFADREGFELDFHTDFFAEYLFNRQERYHDAINSPFEHARESEEEKLTYYLTDDYYYLYSLLHTVKHFETAGCGIRRILDLYFLKKAYENRIDTAFINSVIDEHGFRDTVSKLFAIEELWFEGKETELDISEAVKDIVTSGNHGNEDIFIRNNVRKDIESGVRFPKLRRIYNFIFPSYDYICEGYPECRERGYSLHRARLYRVFATLKKFSFSHALSNIKKIIKSK